MPPCKGISPLDSYDKLASNFGLQLGAVSLEENFCFFDKDLATPVGVQNRHIRIRLYRPR